MREHSRNQGVISPLAWSRVKIQALTQQPGAALVGQEGQAAAVSGMRRPRFGAVALGGGPTGLVLVALRN